MTRQGGGGSGGRGQPEGIVKQVDFPALSMHQLPPNTEFSLESLSGAQAFTSS